MKHMQGRMPYKDPEKRKEYYKQRYQQNKDRWKIYYKHRNKDRLREYHQQYQQQNKDRLREYRQQNKDRLREYKTQYTRTRMQEDQRFKLTKNLRSSLWICLNRKVLKKHMRTHQYLGCSLYWFVTEYWPSKIKAWNAMYPEHTLTANDIEMDHIKPLAKHDDDQMTEAWHYTNLQPLSKHINGLKSDIWSWDDECHWRCNILFNESYIDPYLPVDMPLESNWPKQEISLPVQPTQNASFLGQIPAPVPSFHS